MLLSKNPKKTVSKKDADRLEAIRKRFESSKPTQQQLLESGDYDDFVPHGVFVEIRKTLALLRSLRESQGISLGELAKRTGIDKAALSRLESGKLANPTVATLERYAAGLGMYVQFHVVKLESVGRERSAPQERQVQRMRMGLLEPPTPSVSVSKSALKNSSGNLGSSRTRPPSKTPRRNQQPRRKGTG